MGADDAGRDPAAELGPVLRSFADAFGRAAALWLEQNRPLLEALGRLARDPAVVAWLEARERGEAPPLRRPCHCLCGRSHPGVVNVCDAYAVTSRHYETRELGPVDVALCGPCATAQGITVQAGG